MSLKNGVEHAPPTVRAKLTLFHLILSAVMLLSGFIASYLILQRQLRHEVDVALKQAVQAVETTLEGFCRPSPDLIPLDQLSPEAMAVASTLVEDPTVVLATRREGQLTIFAVSRDLLYRIELSTNEEVRNVESMELISMFQAASEATQELGPVLGSFVAADGTLLSCIDHSGSEPVRSESERFADLLAQVNDEAVFDGVTYRITKAAVAPFGTVRLGIRLGAAQGAMRQLRTAFIVLFCLLVPVTAVIGWLVSSRSMAGVERVAAAAEVIAAGRYDHRVEEGGEGAEINRLVDSFNHMVAQTEGVIRELKQMSSDVAHDLKTPIARMRAALETTDWSCSNQEHVETAGQLIEDCDNLTALVTVILEISQTESGVLTLADESIDPRRELEAAVELFRPAFDDSQKQLAINASTVTGTIRGDRAKLQRVVANLLDNALKFTPVGGTVTVAATETDSTVIVHVSDTGVGIPKDEQSRVFQRFYRCSHSRSTPGNGLGLALAKAIVEAHGGRLGVESEPEKGSDFWIELPKKT